MASVLKVDKLDPQSGTDLEIGSSGDTITIPSGATFTQSGTMNASAITAGTIATARLGSGTASSSTVLYGDQTYKAEPTGGKILQESTESVSIADSNTNDTWQTYSHCSPTLTPAATSSKVLILVNIPRASPGGDVVFFDLRREISGGTDTDNISGESSGLTYNNNSGTAQGTYYSFIDSPSTTSAVTYKINWRNGDDSALTIMGDDNALISISLFEIGA